MSNSIKAFVACGLVMAFSVAASFGQSSHYDVNNMDTKASACTDFYQYANGGWLAANPIPAAYPAWGLANILNEKNRDVLHEILEAAAKNSSVSKGSNEQKVGDYYASCMDEVKIEAAGLQPMQAEFDLVARVNDQKSLQAEIGHLHAMGYNAAFGSGSIQDFKNSTEVIAVLIQGGLGLPNRDYYFKTDDRSKSIRDEYVKHVAKMFELMGDDAAKAVGGSQAVMTLETKLAESSKPPVEMRDTEKLYHRMAMTAVKDVAASISLRRGQSLLEIGHGFAGTLMQACIDLVGEHGTGPTMLDSLPSIPEAQDRIFHFLHEPNVVPPGDFCHSLWQILAVQFCHKLWQNLGTQSSRRFLAGLNRYCCNRIVVSGFRD